MNKNKSSYQNQSKLYNKFNQSNSLNYNRQSSDQLNKHTHTTGQFFNQENMKIGRNKVQPVKTENGNYNLPKVNTTTNFTHSKLKLDFDKPILENINDINSCDDESGLKPSYFNNKNKKWIMKVIILGIVIEIIIIFIVIILKLISGASNSQILSCTSNITDDINQATIQTENLYYFNRTGNYKNEIITTYIFDTKEAFNSYKKNYVDLGIYDVSGLTYENSFNSSKLVYVYKSTYNLKKMKKDKRNISKTDQKITIVDDTGSVLIDLTIDDYEKIYADNISNGYICVKK